MKRDALENIVRDAMTDVEVALNTDEIWRGVEQKLYPKKKKRFGWFLWSFALMAIIALAVIIPMNKTQKSVIVENGSTTINTSTMSLNSDSVSDQEAESQLADNIKLAGINDNVKQSITQIKDKKVENKRSIDKQKISINKIIKTPTKLNSIDKIKEINNNVKPSQTNKSQIGTTLILATNKNNNSEQGNKVLHTNKNSNNLSLILASYTDKNDKRELINIPTLSRPIPVLKMINIKTVWAIVLPILNELENRIEEHVTKSRVAKAVELSTWAWHLDLLMGVDKPYRSLSGNDTKLLALRNNSETVLEGWHFQLTTGVQHRSGIYADFGLSVSNIAEAVEVNTSRQYDKIGVTETSDINKFSQRSTGKTVGSNTYHETTKGTIYSRHTYYSIPLAIGYELPINKWSVLAEVGTEINLVKHSKGHQLYQNNELIEYNTLVGANDIFLKRVGLNWNARLKLTYRFKNNQRLYLAPYIMMSNTSITNKEYALKQSYNRYGIALGYRYSF